MKFFMVIPVIAIFLSNMWLRTDVVAATAAPAEPACCMATDEAEMQCHADNKTEKEAEDCCQSKAARCNAHCCFVVVPPVQQQHRFSAIDEGVHTNISAYQLKHWINPVIDGPLQPPDVV